jgi:osomolarity two-component system sensor histidine kinase NIK1
MTGILGMAGLALDSDLNRSQRESLLHIHSLAQCLLSVINDFSDISKRECPPEAFLGSCLLTSIRSVETDRMVLQQDPFSFRQTVFGTLKTLVSRAASNNLDLTYDVDPDIPDQLIGDYLRLRQVITNLVINATKFTPPRGHVALSCRRLALDDSSVTLEFCVLDTGIGISKDRLNLIFDAGDWTTNVRPALVIYVLRRPTGFL